MELLFESRLEIRRVEGKLYFVQVQPTIHPTPVLEADPNSPVDAGGVSCFGTVLREGGRYRMWYQAWPRQWDGHNSPLVGYAESEDGIAWRRPRLGLVEYGDQANNLCNLNMHSPAVFIDPTAPSHARYRATGGADPGTRPAGQLVHQHGYYTAHSADGLHWILDAPTPRWHSRDVITSVYHPQQQRGIIALKYTPRYGHIPRRSIWTAELRAGVYSEATAALLPDEFDDICAVSRGFVSGDYYGMGMMPAGSGTVGFLWQFRHTLPRTRGAQTGVFGTMDVSLAYQQNPSDRWLHSFGRKDFLSHTALPWSRGGIYTASGVVAHGDEQRLYFCGSLESHGWYLDDQWQINERWVNLTILEHGGMDRIGFAYWPQDRLFGFRSDPEGSLELDLGEPDGPCELWLNYKTLRDGAIHVELPGREKHTLADAVALTGDQTASVAAWQAGTQIMPAPGQPLVVRLHLARADVYAYELRPVA
jgi:hypothetical protein